MERKTPAGYSRALHRQVRDIHSELVAQGYPPDTTMVLLLDVMMQIVNEQGRVDVMQSLLEQLRPAARP